MKEDLAIAKNNLLALYDENRQLRYEFGKDPDSYAAGISGAQISKVEEKDSKEPTTKVVSSEVHELKQRLEEERKLRKEADNELEIQVRNFI